MKARDAAELAGLLEELVRLVAHEQERIRLSRDIGSPAETVAYYKGRRDGVRLALGQVSAFIDSRQ